MPETENEQETQVEETQEESATEQEAASSAATQTFDVEAERARIREQVEAEYTDRQKAAQAVTEPAAEPDIGELMFSDPKAYRVALTKQIAQELRAEIAPAIQSVNTNRTVEALGEGLGNAGRDYLRKNLNGVSIEQIPENLRGVFRDAAETADRRANPERQRLNPERDTTTGTAYPAVARDPELQRFLKHLPADEVAKFIKDNA